MDQHQRLELSVLAHDAGHGTANPDRILDGRVFKAIHGGEGDWSDEFEDEVWHRRDPNDAAAFDAPPTYSSTYEAAASTLPEGTWIVHASQDGPNGRWNVRLGADGVDEKDLAGQGPSLPRAVLDASLNARLVLDMNSRESTKD